MARKPAKKAKRRAKAKKAAPKKRRAAKKSHAPKKAPAKKARKKNGGLRIVAVTETRMCTTGRRTVRQRPKKD